MDVPFRYLPVSPTPVKEISPQALEDGIDSPFFDSFKKDYPEFPSWVASLADDENNRRIYCIPTPGQNGTQFAGLAILKLKEPDCVYPLGQPVSKLCTLKIADEFTNKGYATDLLMVILDELEDHRSKALYLEVKAEHSDVIEFFLDNDFVKLTTRDGYEDEVVMYRDL